MLGWRGAAEDITLASCRASVADIASERERSDSLRRQRGDDSKRQEAQGFVGTVYCVT